MKNNLLFLALSFCLLPAAPVSSAPAPGLRPSSPGAPARAKKDYALFFAVRDYAEWPDLKNPIADAEAVAADLRQFYKFETEVVRNPTRNQILDKLAEYRAKLYDDDAQLLVFFSGHGYFDENLKNGYFVPQNGRVMDAYNDTYLSHLELRRQLTSIPCHHILYIVDACFSGTVDDNLALKGGRGNARAGTGDPGPSPQSLIRDRLTHQSRYFLTSGGKERTADGADHSPFTKKLLEGLRRLNAAGSFFSFEELYQEYMAAMPAPTPRAGKFEGHEGGDFLFIYEPGAEPAEPESKPGRRLDASADSDLDGVPDAIDKCPDEFGVAAAAGCPDADEDGVPDKSDKCKYDAGEKKWQGCPDSDLDGIPDNDDNCPLEKGTAANGGCPKSPVAANRNAANETRATTSPMKSKPDTPTTEDAKKDYADPLAGKMVYVKGGIFLMGNNEETNEKPEHLVTLSDFYIGKYEVTQAQWRAVMGADHPGVENKNCVDCPVEGVNWADIQNFLTKLNQQTGQRYRLPTEAEWEYAAKGGTNNNPFKYAGSTSLENVAWHGARKTQPVGKKMANWLGIFDMSGNVYEWCSDYWAGSYTGQSQTNPTGPGSGSARVLRGGSINKVYTEDVCRVTFRRPANEEKRYYDAGFRIVRASR